MQSGASDRTPVKAIWLFNLLFAHHFQRSKAVARARLISTRVYAIRVVSFDLATANPFQAVSLLIAALGGVNQQMRVISLVVHFNQLNIKISAHTGKVFA
jgi:hypothetical protein